ncbi:unnamed protein product [Urochloa humidicola]
MASSKPCITGQVVVSDSRAVLTLVGAAALPPDAVYEILLRLPGKDLCCLRAVCRPWRSLLSSPSFAAAHAARHAEPLIVAGYATHTSSGGGVLYSILDLSGRVIIRRVHAPADGAGAENEWVAWTGLGLVCVVSEGPGVSCRLLDPAAAAARDLPRGLAEEHAAHEREISHHAAMVAIGKVAATGERKVLRVLHLFPAMSRQLHEILTLDNGGGGSRWRKAMDPAHNVQLGTWAVINSIVYFFSSEFVEGQDVMPDRIASFDLETEQWRPTMRGPLNIRYHHGEHTVRPLLVLDDGRIVLAHIGNRGSLKIYDPRTSSSTDVAELGPCVAVGLYTGSVLSLANGAS